MCLPSVRLRYSRNLLRWQPRNSRLNFTDPLLVVCFACQLFLSRLQSLPRTLLMGTRMRQTDWAERSRTHQYQNALRSDFQGAPYHHRQAFHRPQTALGAAGHLLHMGMVAAPLVIGEVIHDSEKKWRAMRMVPVLGALASEALWTMKIAHDRKREEEAHAELESCREQCR